MAVAPGPRPCPPLQQLAPWKEARVVRAHSYLQAGWAASDRSPQPLPLRARQSLAPLLRWAPLCPGSIHPPQRLLSALMA